MGEATTIAWTDSSWSPWHGCAKVSPGCKNCYADAFTRRIGHGKRLPVIWGVDAERKFMGEEHWKLPRRWNRKAARSGVTHRVFCASMADVFEIHASASINDRMNTARARLWDLIEETPHLTWQLLTKRAENIAALIPSRWRATWPTNIWLGVTAENQEMANRRIPILLRTGAHTKFVSAEPLLGSLDLDPPVCPDCSGLVYALAEDGATPFCPGCETEMGYGAWLDPLDGGISQVIVGGESGPGRRPFSIAWLGNLAEQCRDHGVALFAKQDAGPRAGMRGRIPDDLWVQEFPVDEDDEPGSVVMAAVHGSSSDGSFSMVHVEASGSPAVVGAALDMAMGMASSLRGDA